MTIAEQLREQGMQQGMQQGIQQGEVTMLTLQIQKRFGILPDHYKQMIANANPQILLQWGEKLLDAKKLADIFID